MTKTIGNTERGGFLYFAALILFWALSIIWREVLSVIKVSETANFAVTSLFSVASFSFFTVIYAKNGGKILCLRKFSPMYLFPALMLAFGMILGLGFLNSLVASV